MLMHLSGDASMESGWITWKIDPQLTGVGKYSEFSLKFLCLQLSCHFQHTRVIGMFDGLVLTTQTRLGVRMKLPVLGRKDFPLTTCRVTRSLHCWRQRTRLAVGCSTEATQSVRFK